MPLDQIERAIEVWHAGYQSWWVGFEHLGRNHVMRPLELGHDPQPVYAPTFYSQYAAKPATIPPAPFHSIVLPSGSVLHKDFLHAYHSPHLAQARALVQDITNCEDLLMNFVVANGTGHGPALIRAWDKPFQIDGLWHRPAHLGERSTCLQQFAQIFGMPLRYSSSYHGLAGNITTPQDFVTSSQIPIAYPCSCKVFEQDHICELADHTRGAVSKGQNWI